MTLTAQAAFAHDAGMSRGDYVVGDGLVEARLVFAASDAALVSSPGELIFVDADDEPCARTEARVSPRTGEDAVEVALTFACPTGARAVVIQAAFVGEGNVAGDRAHQHLAEVRVVHPARAFEAVLTSGHDRLQVETGGPVTTHGLMIAARHAVVRWGFWVALAVGSAVVLLWRRR